MITARDLIDGYVNALAAGGEQACREYAADSAAWTARACRALIDAGRFEFPIAAGASKPTKDTYGRAEYLGLDVTLYDPATWGPPLLVAEHENRPLPERVQYDAWKLLVVEAQRRVLVAYFGSGTAITTFDNLEKLVKEVCRDNPKKDIVLIGAEYSARPQTASDLRALHQSAIVGVYM